MGALLGTGSLSAVTGGPVESVIRCVQFPNEQFLVYACIYSKNRPEVEELSIVSCNS